MTNRFNRQPYFDSFDENNGYYHILFRPGVAIQVSEMNALQSGLQNQISRLANYSFEEGQAVIPGEIVTTGEIIYVNVDVPLSELEGYLGKTISVVALDNLGDRIPNEVKLRVIGHSNSNEVVSDKNISTLYCEFLFDNRDEVAFASDASLLEKASIASQILIQPEDNADVSQLIQFGVNRTTLTDENGDTITPIGVAYQVSIEEGVYFLNGYLVRTPPLKIYAGRFTNTPTKSVGFKIIEKFITSADDVALLDRASGTPNESAPGADRYQLILELDARDIDTNNQNNDVYSEVLRIRDGIIEQKIENRDYSELQQILARRTFDESGNYEVNRFSLFKSTFLETYPNYEQDTTDDAPAERDEDGYLVNPNPDDYFVVGVEPGKAFVSGYEIDSIETRHFPIGKARDTETAVSDSITPRIGAYVVLTEIEDSVDEFPEIGDTVNLNPASLNQNDKLGTAKVRFIEKASSGNIRMGLYDIQFGINSSTNRHYVFADVKTITHATTSDLFNATVATANTTAELFDTNHNVSVYAIGQKFVSSVGNIDYTTILKNSDTSSSEGQIDITFRDSQDRSVDIIHNKANILIINDTASSVVADTGYSITSTDGATLIITGLMDNHTYTVYAEARLLNQSPRTKIKTTITETDVAYNADTKSYVLTNHDGIRITAITYNGDDVDITNSFTLDNGQRDGNYVVASAIPDSSVNTAQNINITYEYFRHNNDGSYFSASSYVNIPYNEIPTYTIVNEQGEREDISLSDTIDFRQPLGSVSPTLPRSNTFVDVNNVEYYLPRIDLIALDSNGLFSIVRGDPNIIPKPKATPKDSMTLAEIYIDPFTANVDVDVSINQRNNRRYRMRDIVDLDDRLTNAENYITLNLLERETASLDIRDEQGNNRFKNGFIVDNFSSHFVSDLEDDNYSASIDIEKKELRPTYDTLNSEPVWQANTTNNIKVHDNGIITLDYIEEVGIDNNQATRSIDIAPYKVGFYNAVVNLTPSTDTWLDQKENPKYNVDLGNIGDSSATNSLGTTYGAWQSSWYGKTAQNNARVARGERTIYTQRRITTVATAVRGRQSFDRVVNVEHKPIARQRAVIVQGSKLKANSRYFPFFDGKDVSANVVPSTVLRVSEDLTATKNPYLSYNNHDYFRSDFSDKGRVAEKDYEFGTIALGERQQNAITINTIALVTTNNQNLDITVDNTDELKVGNNVMFYGFDKNGNLPTNANIRDYSSNAIFRKNGKEFLRGTNNPSTLNDLHFKVFKILSISGNNVSLTTLDDATTDAVATTATPTELTTYDNSQNKGRLYKLQPSAILVEEDVVYDFATGESRYDVSGKTNVVGQRNYYLVNQRNSFGVGEVMTVEDHYPQTILEDLTTRNLQSNYNGRVVGTFYVPAGTLTGSRKFKLTDNANNSDDAFDSYGFATYTALGLGVETGEVVTRPMTINKTFGGYEYQKTSRAYVSPSYRGIGSTGRTPSRGSYSSNRGGGRDGGGRDTGRGGIGNGHGGGGVGNPSTDRGGSSGGGGSGGK